MQPTPDTPFADVSDEWRLAIRCRCKLVHFAHAWRERHFAPDLKAARLCARLRCETCGERPSEAAWESTRVGSGGLRLDPQRVRVM